MRPSCEGVSPHSQRTAGPRKDSSIISIASAAQAQPQYSSSTTWKRPKPARAQKQASASRVGRNHTSSPIFSACASHNESVQAADHHHHAVPMRCDSLNAGLAVPACV